MSLFFFHKVLSQYEDFWDMLDEIDSNTWVLEPDYPSRSCTNRRIALGNNASIHIDLNPANPRLLPECRFMGADNGIEEKVSSSFIILHSKNVIILEVAVIDLLYTCTS